MRPRILIADDYADAATSLALLLASLEADTRIALDGEQALEYVRTWRPHICVLDLQMPKVDGRDIARELRNLPIADRPLLIALTGWATNADRSSALDAGFDRFMTKPVEPSKLMSAIVQHLGQHPEQLPRARA